jgi:hypothetical protein
VVRNYAWETTRLFGIAYLCEQFFQREISRRNRLDGEILENCLRVATSQIYPDVNFSLVKSVPTSSLAFFYSIKKGKAIPVPGHGGP